MSAPDKQNSVWRYIKKHISYVPFIALLLLVALKITYTTYQQSADQDPVLSDNATENIDCKKFCAGFINCAVSILGADARERNQQNKLYMENACFAGCQKQSHLLANCQLLVIQKKCDAATECLQKAISGQ